MLNKKKQISLKIKNNISTPSFFSLPFLPVDSYLQANSNPKNLDYLNLIFKDLNSKVITNNFRYNFCSKSYRTSFLFTKYARKKPEETKFKKFKKYLLFLNNLYKSSKKYPLTVAKQIKGGFMTRSFGINTFMPRSHYLKKKKGGTKQVLLQIKAWRRKKKNYSKKNWKFKINMVSSAKNAKNLSFASSKKFSSKKYL
jgi:hypothetical protein